MDEWGLCVVAFPIGQIRKAIGSRTVARNQTFGEGDGSGAATVLVRRLPCWKRMNESLATSPLHSSHPRVKAVDRSYRAMYVCIHTTTNLISESEGWMDGWRTNNDYPIEFDTV